jgi:hypothetical protein
MARTSVNVRVSSASSWTVPAGKTFVGKAFATGTGDGNAKINVNGVEIAVFYIASGTVIATHGPLTGNAGDVFSNGSANHPYGLSGFLYDN